MTTLYITNLNPRLAPRDLDDNRLITQCLDCAQILSTALYRNNLWNSLLFRPLWNHDHEVVRWAAQSRNNFRFVYHFGMAACDEYLHRFGHDNSSRVQIALCWDAFRAREEVFPATELTELPNTTPYKTEPNVDDAYRKYLNIDKWVFVTPRWTGRGPPEWFKVPERQYPTNLFA